MEPLLASFSSSTGFDRGRSCNFFLTWDLGVPPAPKSMLIFLFDGQLGFEPVAGVASLSRPRFASVVELDLDLVRAESRSQPSFLPAQTLLGSVSTVPNLILSKFERSLVLDGDQGVGPPAIGHPSVCGSQAGSPSRDTVRVRFADSFSARILCLVT